MTDGPLRVGRISALNMHPIYHHLEGPGGRHLAFTDGLPTTLNRALLEGRLDVSAVSSITYARNAERLRLLPVASITAAGAVDSIQLFSRVPFEAVRSVAVTPHSASSVALLRVLVGPEVVFTPLDGSASEALSAHDGVLLIADEALRELRAGRAAHATDLGARWRERTGLPMVFAVWAVRDDVARARPDEIAAFAELLRDAIDRYDEDPGGAVASATQRFPFPAEMICEYFGRLRYGFGDDERAGLGRFFELAVAAGELDRVPPAVRDLAVAP